MPSRTIAKTDGRWSLWQLFCVLWGGVHKGSNVRKCRIKHIQLYRVEKIGLKALLDSSQPKFQEELEIPRFGGRFGYFFVFCGVGTQRFKCSKAHTETPMTQRGRAAASDSSNDLVSFVPFNCFHFN